MIKIFILLATFLFVAIKGYPFRLKLIIGDGDFDKVNAKTKIMLYKNSYGVEYTFLDLEFHPRVNQSFKITFDNYIPKITGLGFYWEPKNSQKLKDEKPFIYLKSISLEPSFLSNIYRFNYTRHFYNLNPQKPIKANEEVYLIDEKEL